MIENVVFDLHTCPRLVVPGRRSRVCQDRLSKISREKALGASDSTQAFAPPHVAEEDMLQVRSRAAMYRQRALGEKIAETFKEPALQTRPV